MAAGLPVVDGTQRCLSAVEELAARWHRHDTGADDVFGSGLRAGWGQAIALILGVEYSAALAALQEGKL